MENVLLKLPFVYINKQEVVDFLSSLSIRKKDGFSYEWENEYVIHLRLNKANHVFGEQGCVLFTKDSQDKQLLGVYDYIVYVESEDNIKILSKKYCNLKTFFIPSKLELYSRNKGILELNVLENKRVVIVGLGSFGSQIAIELAKAGVGKFALFDFDRVELHNLVRHTATLNDLGRLKTDVLEDAINGKNPYAIVDKFPIDINEDLNLLSDEIAKSDIVICGTDNNKSRFVLSQVLIEQQKIGIFGRAVTRAEGGDVFRYRPGGPCYCCLVGNNAFAQMAEEITNEESARRNGQIPAYMSAEEADAIVQVGLSADIEPICNLMIKLALMELSRGTDSGISSLESELIYDYYMWANRRERRHVNWSPMPNAGNRPTILRWYGARIDRDVNCSVCSQNIILDEGEEIEFQINNFN